MGMLMDELTEWTKFDVDPGLSISAKERILEALRRFESDLFNGLSNCSRMRDRCPDEYDDDDPLPGSWPAAPTRRPSCLSYPSTGHEKHTAHAVDQLAEMRNFLVSQAYDEHLLAEHETSMPAAGPPPEPTFNQIDFQAIDMSKNRAIVFRLDTSAALASFEKRLPAMREAMRLEYGFKPLLIAVTKDVDITAIDFRPSPFLESDAAWKRSDDSKPE